MRPINALVLGVALSLMACAPHKSAPKAENFPVVVPFAIDRAGSKVTVEFELPNALDPYFKEPILRPVFIGVRRVEDKGGGAAELKEWMRRSDYLQRNTVPIHLAVQQWNQGRWVPVALHEMHDNIVHGQGSVWYEPISDTHIVSRLRRLSPDHTELQAIGQKREDKVYDTYEWARIVPPTPGRYRLEIESQQDHSNIRDLTFELLVSHNYQHGIQ